MAAFTIAALLLVQSIPAFAVDNTPTATGAFSPPLFAAGEGTDTYSTSNAV